MVGCSGATGHNVEYVLRLADWFRLNFPDVMDDHLFTIETHIRWEEWVRIRRGVKATNF